MAVRAVAHLREVANFNYPNNQYALIMSVAIIGEEFGNVGPGNFEYIYDQTDPDLPIATTKTQVETAIKNYLISQSVPFGPQDVVHFVTVG